jgi:signal peptidase II
MPQASADNFKSLPALLRFFGVTAAGLAIDLWTKHLTDVHLAPKSPDEIGEIARFIPGWLHFEYVRNHGAVFGIGQGARPLFVVVSVAAIAFLSYLFSTSGRQRGYQILLGILLAGVLGNLYDRIVFGFVRDMIHVLPRWPNLYPWVFNVADMFLCVGVVFMVLYSFVHKDEASQVEKGEGVIT